MHSPDDFGVSGLEVGDAHAWYLVSCMEVRIALILITHPGRSWGCTPPRMYLLDDFRGSGLEVGDALISCLGSGLEVR